MKPRMKMSRSWSIFSFECCVVVLIDVDIVLLSKGGWVIGYEYGAVSHGKSDLLCSQNSSSSFTQVDEAGLFQELEEIEPNVRL